MSIDEQVQETGEPVKLNDVVKAVNDWAKQRDANIVRINGQPATAWTVLVASTSGGPSIEVCERTLAAVIERLDTWYASIKARELVGEHDDPPTPPPVGGPEGQP